MPNRFSQIEASQCPSCWEWFPISKLKSIVMDMFWNGRLAENNIAHPDTRIFLDFRETKMCEECIARIEAKDY